MKCNNCGNEIAPNSTVCPFCRSQVTPGQQAAPEQVAQGAPEVQINQQTTQTQTMPVYQVTEKKTNITGVIIVIVIIVAAIAGFIIFSNKKEEDKVKKETEQQIEEQRKSTFIQYGMKIVKDTLTSYVNDSLTTIPGKGVFIYDIKTDLGYTSSGNYKGYIVVDTEIRGEIDKPHYTYYLTDENYMIIDWDVVEKQDYPKPEDLMEYNSKKDEEIFKNSYTICTNYRKDGKECLNRKNYIIAEGPQE